MNQSIRVQTHDFSVGEEYQALRRRMAGDTGAVASFVGLVRDLAGGDDVQSLYLEHYPGMTERSIAAIVDEAERRWQLTDALIIHRVGALQPRDQIVLVQVASGHRAAAFAACEYIMDYLKTDAVFWKREDTGSGRRWVQSTAEDRERVAAWKTE